MINNKICLKDKEALNQKDPTYKDPWIDREVQIG